MRSLENILVLNSLHKEDRLYWEFELFESVCREMGLDFKTKTVVSSCDFIDTINSTNPEFLVYFGHGCYNAEKDEGELIFRDDKLSHRSFDKIQNIPPVVYLIGCETASCSAFVGGIPSHLFERGAFAIIATLLPITADRAAAFLGRTLSLADDLIRKGKTTMISNLIFSARKLGCLKDNLDALEKNGTISLRETATIFKVVVDDLGERSLKRKKDLPLSEAIPIFLEYLKNYDLLETWQQIKPKIIPYSTFFTLLGNSHDVFIGGQ